MSRIRLLFAPENFAFAERIRAALEICGYETTTGERPASAVLVIWSPAAAASPAILASARQALAKRVLVPVALGKSPPPPSFEHLWPMDLSGWSGADNDPRWRFVLDEIELAVRRGVEVEAPALAMAGGGWEEPPLRPAPRPRPAPAAPAAAPSPSAPDRSASELFAEYAPEEPRTLSRPGRPAPALLIGGVAALFAVVSGGSYLAGRLSRPAASSDPAPKVALIAPDRQPKDGFDDDAAAAPRRSADPAAAAAAPSENDRARVEAAIDGLETPADEASAWRAAPPAEAAAELAAPLAAPPVVDAERGESAPPPGAPADAPAPVRFAEEAPASADEEAARVKQDAIAALAESAVAESEADDSPAPSSPAPEASAPEAVDDPIAELASAAAALSAETVGMGNYFRDCVECPDMAEIPPPPDDGATSVYERYAIGVREVTVKEWRACVADGACSALPAGASGDAAPAVNVSFSDALAYVAWLSARTGVRYRLPTEAEWETAARAGGEPLGVGVPPDPWKANIRAQGVQRAAPTPAGTFPPNGFGVYDMAGNVWEWTADCSGDAVDPCAQRILKGGAFDTPASGVSDAYRAPAPAEARRPNAGFRLARDLN
jgi:hypothetical protein